MPHDPDRADPSRADTGRWVPRAAGRPLRQVEPAILDIDMRLIGDRSADRRPRPHDDVDATPVSAARDRGSQ